MQPNLQPMDILNQNYDRQFFATHVVRREGDRLISQDTPIKQDVPWGTGVLTRSWQWWQGDKSSPDQVNGVFVETFQKVLDDTYRHDPRELTALRERLTHLIENGKVYEEFKKHIFSQATLRPYGLSPLTPLIERAEEQRANIDKLLAAKGQGPQQHKMEKLGQALEIVLTKLLTNIPEGVFRVEGEGTQVTSWANDIKNKSLEELKEKIDGEHSPHTLAKAIARVVRDLDPPLIGAEVYPFFMAAAEETNEREKKTILRSAIGLLPPENKKILNMLLSSLRTIRESSALNKMTASNLAIVWAPNLLQSPQDLLIADLQKTLNVTTFMIQNDLT